MNEHGNGTAALHALWAEYRPQLDAYLGWAQGRYRGGADRDDVRQQYHLCTWRAILALAPSGPLTLHQLRGIAKRAYLHSVSRAIPRVARRAGARARPERQPPGAGEALRFDPFKPGQLADATSCDPATVAEKRDLLARLFSAIDKTTRRRLKLLAIGHSGHYVARLTGCTDGRISQLRSAAAAHWAVLNNPE